MKLLLSFQDQIDVSDNLKLLIGARYDDYEITVNNLKPGSEGSVTKGEDLLSPRAGVIFKPQENISLYASYSNTFAPKAGEQYKAMSNGTVKDAAGNVYDLGRVLDADETETSEIGLKWAISDELYLAAAYFQAEREAMSTIIVNGSAEQQAAVNQEIDGYELELSGRISDQLELSLSYADFEGDNVAQNKEIPDYQFSAFANYQVNDKFGIGFGLTSQGDQQIGSWQLLLTYRVSQELMLLHIIKLLTI